MILVWQSRKITTCSVFISDGLAHPVFSSYRSRQLMLKVCKCNILQMPRISPLNLQFIYFIEATFIPKCLVLQLRLLNESQPKSWDGISYFIFIIHTRLCCHKKKNFRCVLSEVMSVITCCSLPLYFTFRQIPKSFYFKWHSEIVECLICFVYCERQGSHHEISLSLFPSFSLIVIYFFVSSSRSCKKRIYYLLLLRLSDVCKFCVHFTVLTL